LPNFYYSCGIIGHSEKACPARTRRTCSSQFGPWLREIQTKRKIGFQAIEVIYGEAIVQESMTLNMVVMVHHGGRMHQVERMRKVRNKGRKER
jgi:ribosome modulation factor